jgi:hypothetical protein
MSTGLADISQHKFETFNRSGIGSSGEGQLTIIMEQTCPITSLDVCETEYSSTSNQTILSKRQKGHCSIPLAQVDPRRRSRLTQHLIRTPKRLARVKATNRLCPCQKVNIRRHRVKIPPLFTPFRSTTTLSINLRSDLHVYPVHA